ncbi:hypothetical protein [Paenirhodobacter enshiensis]|uniref:Uncharacterized protein n=1 Tax=Paenirhodobacter enshiensis TaxID=1105367 RepID=A0A086XQN1_9RHOB|nr:hypothetical protein [Paenirhodobacter enshiensis]KFI24331.1 hypothetical protein CG50_10815 [Paenirhodobacter enshiensis]
MTKLAIRFARSHGSYNAGEVAALEAEIALALIAKGVAAKHTKQPAVSGTTSANSSDLDGRSAELDAREAAVAAREAAMDAAATVTADFDKSGNLYAKQVAQEATAAAVATYEAAQETTDAAEDAAPVDDTGLPTQGK